MKSIRINYVRLSVCLSVYMYVFLYINIYTYFFFDKKPVYKKLEAGAP